MPLIDGYSQESFELNFLELERKLPKRNALAAAYGIGRKAWRRKHGNAPYPEHLRRRRRKQVR